MTYSLLVNEYDEVRVPMWVIDGGNIRDVLGETVPKEEFVEFMQPLIGRMLYYSTYNTTPKQGLVRGFIYGQPLVIESVEYGTTMWGVSERDAIEIKLQFPKIDESPYKDEINQHLKELKIKEKSFEGKLGLNNNTYISTDFSMLPISYKKMIEDTLDRAFSEFEDRQYYILTRMSPDFIAQNEVDHPIKRIVDNKD